MDCIKEWQRMQNDVVILAATLSIIMFICVRGKLFVVQHKFHAQFLGFISAIVKEIFSYVCQIAVY